ncbi:MAG: acyltransferase family protein [Bacteroidetes bacterium]|nr:acyltransferase family protein [Bacteroidota bacterium]
MLNRLPGSYVFSMTQDQSIPIRKRAVHFDLVRFIATFIVVQLHVATPWLWRELDVNSGFWITCLIFDTFGRVGVPIFLMISGALLLSKEESYPSFFKKRFVRVLLPLVFWTIVYEIKIIADHHYLKGGVEWSTLYSVMKNPFTGPVYDHLWFLYMIVGMYLVTPFLRRIIPVLRKQDLYYLLGLWVFSNVFLPLVYNYTTFKLGLSIPVVTSYLGFYVLGYYLMQYQFNAKQIKIAWITFAVSYIVNILLVWMDSNQHDKVDIFYLSHHRPAIFVQAVAAFILLEHYAMKAFANFSEKKYKLLAYLGSVTFGIYLLHPLIIELFEGVFMGIIGIYPPAMTTAPVITIPITAIIITSITMGIVTLMQKTPFLKNFV